MIYENSPNAGMPVVFPTEWLVSEDAHFVGQIQ